MSPEDIIRVVNKMEMDRATLHERMDADFDRYNLVAYAGETGEDGNPLLEGYKKFTSNDPRTSMNLAMHLLSTAPVLVRVRKPKAQKDQREIDNLKELFALGILQSVDTRRADLMMPSLQDGLTAQCLMRGRTAQRVLLIKEELDPSDAITPELEQALDSIEQIDRPDTERAEMETSLRNLIPQTRTFVDIQDWDPRNTYWGMGKHGLAWACHKITKTADEWETEYDITLESDGNDATDRDIEGYDYFDEGDNLVIIENGRELKKRTPHGMGTVPVDIHMVGGLPFFQAAGKDYEVNYGESFYQSDREMYDQQNFILSVLAELSKRSISQGLLVFSQDGQLSLDGDPRISGAETPMRTGQEDIKPMPPMEMVKESSALMGVIAQMVQRGTFPASVFGELAFQLSGFAITQLRQGMEAPISPSVKTVKISIKGILNILADAYVSGNFDTMTLSGRMQDVGRTDFEEEISIESMEAGGMIEVEVVPQLPQDDAAKATLAQILTAGDVPLVDHRFAREHIIQLQDVEQVERAVQEQLAKTGSPTALAFSNMLAAAEQGDMELAQVWHMEFQIQMMQRMMEMAQLQAVGAGATGGTSRNGGGTARPSPSVLPPAIQGTPPPTPTPQAGPIAAPGTPRPNRNGGTAL